jgi:hypothetical protein
VALHFSKNPFVEMASRESPDKEKDDGEREEGDSEWIVYDKEHEESGDERKTRTQVIFREEGEGSSPEGSSGNSLMMSSYLEITNYIPGTDPSTDQISGPSPARPEYEFHDQEDHDRCLPPEKTTDLKDEGATLSVDVNESLLSPTQLPVEEDETGAFSPPLKTEVIISPIPEVEDTNGKNRKQQRQEEGNLPSAEGESEIHPPLNLDGHGEGELEWWKRVNGYSLAALVVGTASILAYSMARNK